MSRTEDAIAKSAAELVAPAEELSALEKRRLTIARKTLERLIPLLTPLFPVIGFRPVVASNSSRPGSGSAETRYANRVIPLSCLPDELWPKVCLEWAKSSDGRYEGRQLVIVEHVTVYGHESDVGDGCLQEVGFTGLWSRAGRSSDAWEATFTKVKCEDAAVDWDVAAILQNVSAQLGPDVMRRIIDASGAVKASADALEIACAALGGEYKLVRN